MARTPRDKLNRELDTVEELAIEGVITQKFCKRLLEWADALDGETTRRKYFDKHNNSKTFEPRSIEVYCQSLRLCAERGLDLMTCSVEEFNAFIDGQHDDRGLSKVTLMRYQAAARTFYRYHDDLGIDPEKIHVYSERSEPRHDEQDMFSVDEVEALRDACDRPRDRAFLELLIYTGQRITALHTLRIKDIDLEKGALYLNDEVDGMKGALGRSRKRPLFGARKYVRDWLQYHPNADDPDAPLFIGDPNHWRTKVDEPWSKPGIRKHLKRIAERAGVDKPVNPHNFRHYFVTVMKREHSMDDGTLRMLLGVAPDSAVLNTVYSHVTDDDYVRKAEIQLGYRDEDNSASLTPEACPTCGELLQDHWRRCPSCSEVFGPELKEFQTDVTDAREELLEEATDPDAEFSAAERRALREMLNAVDDPIALADKADVK